MDPATPCWAFGSNHTLGFWETRMVNETGVHRVDAEAAVGRDEPLTDHVAELGLDEFADMWLPLGEIQTLEVVAEDLDLRWVYGEGAPTATVTGSGSDIYLRLMSRPSPTILPPDWADAVDGQAPAVKR
jgi:uncharacterized protein (TIGR03083 family)